MPTYAHKYKTFPVNLLIVHCSDWTKARVRPLTNAEANLRIIYMFFFNHRVSTKSKAPSPPGLKRLDSPGFSQWCPGNPHLTMDQKENLIDKDLSLVVVLPGGEEKMTVVHGRYSLNICIGVSFHLSWCLKFKIIHWNIRDGQEHSHAFAHARHPSFTFHTTSWNSCQIKSSH